MFTFANNTITLVTANACVLLLFISLFSSLISTPLFVVIQSYETRINNNRNVADLIRLRIFATTSMNHQCNK